MKKVLLIALVLICFALPSLSESRVMDEADLFTDAQEAALEEKIAAIQEQYQMDVAIVTRKSIGRQSVARYAADTFEEMGMGYGPNQDGLLFLISMAERDYFTDTHGDATRIFTDWGLDQIHADVQPYLTDGEYYTGMERYLRHVNTYLAQAEKGAPYDIRNQVKLQSPLERANKALPFILIAAAVITLIVMLVLKGQMKTVRRQAAASSYVEDGSFHLNRRQDIYLYTTTHRRRIETNSGGSRSGGGSSTFHSSSGGSHGGRGGKF